jgi:RNA polymerase sigma-70 factor (ECF subfamily)
MGSVLEDDPLGRYAAAAIEGDDVAVAELVRLTQPAVWQLCTALGSNGETEDLVQETYLRALKALPAFRGDAPVRLWLLAIARRTCADHVRRRERRRRLIRRVASEPTVIVSAPPQVADDLLDGLDADRRDAFVLTQLVGLSYDEAALVVGCPIGTIRSRVARARSDLQALVRQAEAG